ncbi:MAG: FAD binding domain-containing protein [Thermodesulfobacteriota bacterium]
MNLPQFEFIQPHSLHEACSLLQEYRGKAALLAGGTALVVGLRYRLTKPAIVIGLKGLTDLNYLSQTESGGLVIGSMTTLDTLEKSLWVLNEYPSLVQAIRMVAVPPVRNKATLGGNLCLDTRCIYYNQSEFWRSSQKPCFKLQGDICHAVEKGKRCQAVYQGDLGPLLIALGAEVKIVSSKEEKIIPLMEFFTGRGERPNTLGSDEILTEVRIPPLGEGVISTYEKLRVREGMDFPMAGVALMVKRNPNGTIEQAKIVLGAVGSSPIEVPKASKLLHGQKPSEEIFQQVSEEAMEAARPVPNLIINAGYRRKMVGVLVRRAFRKALAT